MEYSVPVSDRDAIVFALGIQSDNLRLLYENHLAFDWVPFFPLASLFRGMFWESATSGANVLIPPHDGLDYDPLLILHGEVGIILDPSRPRPPPSPLTFTSRISSVMPKLKKGTPTQRPAMHAVETSIDVSSGPRDRNTAPYAKISSVALLRQSTYSGRPIPPTRSVLSPLKPPLPNLSSTPRSHECTITIPPTAAALYRLSGDGNPIHIDQSLAPLLRGGSPPTTILHGVATLSMAVTAISKDIRQTSAPPSPLVDCEEPLMSTIGLRGRFCGPVTLPSLLVVHYTVYDSPSEDNSSTVVWDVVDAATKADFEASVVEKLRTVAKCEVVFEVRVKDTHAPVISDGVFVFENIIRSSGAGGRGDSMSQDRQEAKL